MQPCYTENISISRGECCNEFPNNDEPQSAIDNYVDDYGEGYRRRASVDATGHICIEVTREKNEGFDIINVEYKNGCEACGNEHDCRFAEALSKLENIVSFLNKY